MGVSSLLFGTMMGGGNKAGGAQQPAPAMPNLGWAGSSAQSGSAGMSPQAIASADRINAIHKASLSAPQFSATTPNAGATAGIANMATALMAQQAKKNWQKKWGVAPPQAAAPAQNATASAAPGTAPAAAVADTDH